MQNAMEYGKAFTFPQQETDWVKKVGIASAVQLIPAIGGIMLLGYTVEVTRRVINNEAQALPEWSDFGGILKKGLYALVVIIVYGLPLFLLIACSSIPSAVLSSQGDNNLALAGSVLGACFGCFAFLYSIAFGIVLPAALGRLAAAGEIGAAFKIGEVIALVRAKPAAYVVTWLLSSLAYSILLSVGFIVCFVGMFVGSAYGGLIAAHLAGQAYRLASAEGGVAPAAPAA